MLVCNVSMRPARRAIAAELAEAVAAADATATGNIVFATLVDDPASVGAIVDAYLGEIMLEAASASDSLSSGAGYAGAIGEAESAGDAVDATKVAAVAVVTTVGAVGPLPPFDTTFDPSSLTVIDTER